MSELINLNDTEFDVNNVVVFNGGNAGKAENVSIRVEKKTSTDNSPDWKLYFKDSNGGEINEGFYYLDPKHENYKKQLKYQGAALKHIIHAVYGNVELPNFASAKEMLEKCMVKLQGVEEGKKFRVAVTYGTVRRPSPYLRLKAYPEFMEPMSVPAEESKIVITDAYLMVRPVADDNEQVSTDFSTTSTVVNQNNEDSVNITGFDTPSDNEGTGPDDLPF